MLFSMLGMSSAASTATIASAERISIRVNAARDVRLRYPNLLKDDFDATPPAAGVSQSDAASCF